MFDERDIVLIGEGSCGRAAFRDAVEVDAIPVIMKSSEAWYADAANVPLPDGAIFDLGKVPQNREVLALLQRKLGCARVFLAGEIPHGTAFRSPPLDNFGFAVQGEHPRRMERRALEKSMTDFGLIPSSLHQIHRRSGGTADEARRRRDRQEAPRLLHQWQTVRTRCLAKLANGFRPQFDMIRESTDTALATEWAGGEVFAVSWLGGPFDTAFFCDRLADAYLADGAERVVLDCQVVLLGESELIKHCDTIGLDLHLIETGV